MDPKVILTPLDVWLMFAAGIHDTLELHQNEGGWPITFVLKREGLYNVLTGILHVLSRMLIFQVLVLHKSLHTISQRTHYLQWQ